MIWDREGLMDSYLSLQPSDFVETALKLIIVRNCILYGKYMLYGPFIN